MFEVLERIRERPRTQRQAIAFSTAGVITGVIFVLWLISFLTSIQDTQETVTSQSESELGFSSFIHSFQEASDIFEKEVESAKTQFEFISNEIQNQGTEQKIKINTQYDAGVSTADTQTLPEEAQAGETGIEITPSGVEIIQVDE